MAIESPLTQEHKEQMDANLAGLKDLDKQIRLAKQADIDVTAMEGSLYNIVHVNNSLQNIYLIIDYLIYDYIFLSILNICVISSRYMSIKYKLWDMAL